MTTLYLFVIASSKFKRCKMYNKQCCGSVRIFSEPEPRIHNPELRIRVSNYLRIRQDPDPTQHSCGSGYVGAVCFLASRIRSINTTYGSGSFHHKAKIVRKTMNPTVCDFFMTFYLGRRKILLVAVLKVTDENSRIGIR
jgi:hypothetical protein